MQQGSDRWVSITLSVLIGLLGVSLFLYMMHAVVLAP